ncbi:hypothetical protein FBY12_2792 [Pseudomonas sp. SJZ131]|nr:hypothetical protein FBY12_2792 [Pseudomonas sp. SJZ131]
MASLESPSRASSAPTGICPKLEITAPCGSKACPRWRPWNRHREQAQLPQGLAQSSISPLPWEQGLPAMASLESPSRASSAPTGDCAKLEITVPCGSKACPRWRPWNRHREQAQLPQGFAEGLGSPLSEGARLARDGVLEIAIASKLSSHWDLRKAWDHRSRGSKACPRWLS